MAYCVQSGNVQHFLGAEKDFMKGKGRGGFVSWYEVLFGRSVGELRYNIWKIWIAK